MSDKRELYLVKYETISGEFEFYGFKFFYAKRTELVSMTYDWFKTFYGEDTSYEDGYHLDTTGNRKTKVIGLWKVKDMEDIKLHIGVVE